MFEKAKKFVEDKRGDIVEWAIGVVFAVVLGLSVALQVAVDTIGCITGLDTTTQTVVNLVPLFIGLAVMLIILGRRRV
jgi:hypothetical protein